MVQFCRFVSILKKFGGLYKHHAIPNQDWNRKIMNYSNVGINQTKDKTFTHPNETALNLHRVILDSTSTFSIGMQFQSTA